MASMLQDNQLFKIPCLLLCDSWRSGDTVDSVRRCKYGIACGNPDAVHLDSENADVP